MKKKYISPTVEKIEFVTEDIIAVSGDSVGDGEASNNDTGWSGLF